MYKDPLFTELVKIWNSGSKLNKQKGRRNKLFQMLEHHEATKKNTKNVSPFLPPQQYLDMRLCYMIKDKVKKK